MVGVVTENKNTDESEPDPPACELLVRALTTCASFASSFDSFLSLILSESAFQYSNSLESVHRLFFRSLKPALDFDLPRSPLSFRLELLRLTVNASAYY